MKILAIVPLVALLSAPTGAQAQSEKQRIEELVEVALQAIEEKRRGARLGLGLANWVEGPVEGVEVELVTPGGPSEQAGLKAGDLLTSINAESLAGDSSQESYEKLHRLMAEMEPGSQVTVGFRRDGEDLDVQVTTEAWPQVVTYPAYRRQWRLGGREGDWARRLANSFRGRGGNVDLEVELDDQGGDSRRVVRMRRSPAEMLTFYDVAWRLQGLQIAELTPALGEYFGAKQGLLVVRAPDDEEIGLEDGDVIREIGGRAFRDARQATRILRSYEPGEEVKLEVLRHKRSRTITFELPEREGEFPRGEMFIPPTPGISGTSPVTPSAPLTVPGIPLTVPGFPLTTVQSDAG